ncbi:MAG: carbon storage regulator [Planctomycetota bacterium]
MIVIPRTSGESVVIADDIVVTVVDVEGDTVHLSIDYPPDVSVCKRKDAEHDEQSHQSSALS